MLTQERLKEVARYCPDTGIFTWKVTHSNNAKVGSECGYLNTLGYRAMVIHGERHLAHRLSWLYMAGSFPANNIDHINQKRNDNRWENLRDVTQRENIRNSTLRSDNTSGFTGVCWNKRKSKWAAQIQVDGKNKNLGLFSDINDAIAARKAANIKHGFHENHGKQAF